MVALTRRHFLSGLAGLAGASLVGGVSGCGSQVSISNDPTQLVLWRWKNSVSDRLLAQAAEQIPGTAKRLRNDLIDASAFDTKLRTSLAGGSYIPDVTALNSNCAIYFTDEREFVDLNELGAAGRARDFFDWKWKLGTTPTGRQMCWPIDIGPTGFYYRADLFEQAGLDPDPAAVSAAVDSWEKWIEVGREVKGAIGAALEATASDVFSRFIDASPERYFTADDQPVYARDGSAVRTAWETAVQAIRSGVTANAQTSTDQNASYVGGKIAGHISASWWGSGLAGIAPETKGRWRLAAQPAKAGNYGGSFLAIPRTSKDPQAAYAFIEWLTSPQNQGVAYNELQLFPSTPASFAGGGLRDESGFFGDQDALAFFARAAESVPTTFISAYESQTTAFAQEIENVEAAGKDPDQAWRDAVTQCDRVLAKRGVV